MTKDEQETVLRFDRSSDAADFYTADGAEARRWTRLGYDVAVVSSRAGRPTSWRATVPVAAVALLPLRDGQVKVPRWLSPPTVSDRAVKAAEPREPEKTGEFVKENSAEFADANTTAAER